MGTSDLMGNLLSEDVQGPRYGLDFSAWGFIGLGEYRRPKVQMVLFSALASFSIQEMIWFIQLYKG
jgi:hypothetical protein